MTLFKTTTVKLLVLAAIGWVIGIMAHWFVGHSGPTRPLVNRTLMTVPAGGTQWMAVLERGGTPLRIRLESSTPSGIGLLVFDESWRQGAGGTPFHRSNPVLPCDVVVTLPTKPELIPEARLHYLVFVNRDRQGAKHFDLTVWADPQLSWDTLVPRVAFVALLVVALATVLLFGMRTKREKPAGEYAVPPMQRQS